VELAPRGRSAIIGDEPVEQIDEADCFSRMLYDRYFGRLQAFVLRLTDGNRQLTEDVVQETFLRAWQHADELSADPARGLMPWLATVARGIANNEYRRRRARPHEVDGALLAHAITEDGTEVSLRRLIILDALASLTPAHRRVVVEVSLKGNTAAEAAMDLGIPTGTVKSRLHHALRALRNAMTAQGVTN